MNINGLRQVSLNFSGLCPEGVLSHSNYSFHTPDELSHLLQPVSTIQVEHPISWADEERDLTAWLGNDLQDDAFNKLYEIEEKVSRCNDPDIMKDWRYLQTSDHFYYMCTKWFSDGDVHKYFNPFNSPYEAFINYMNILSDFIIRINEKCPDTEGYEILSELKNVVNEKILQKDGKKETSKTKIPTIKKAILKTTKKIKIANRIKKKTALEKKKSAKPIKSKQNRKPIVLKTKESELKFFDILSRRIN